MISILCLLSDDYEAFSDEVLEDEEESVGGKQKPFKNIKYALSYQKKGHCSIDSVGHTPKTC